MQHFYQVLWSSSFLIDFEGSLQMLSKGWKDQAKRFLFNETNKVNSSIAKYAKSKYLILGDIIENSLRIKQ